MALTAGKPAGASRRRAAGGDCRSSTARRTCTGQRHVSAGAAVGAEQMEENLAVDMGGYTPGVLRRFVHPQSGVGSGVAPLRVNLYGRRRDDGRSTRC